MVFAQESGGPRMLASSLVHGTKRYSAGPLPVVVTLGAPFSGEVWHVLFLRPRAAGARQEVSLCVVQVHVRVYNQLPAFGKQLFLT